MNHSSAVQEQLRLESALLSLDGYIISIVIPGFEPGIFFKHVENTRVDLKESKKGHVARLSTVGGPVPWQVLRIDLTHEELPEFERFVARARQARNRSLASN